MRQSISLAVLWLLAVFVLAFLACSDSVPTQPPPSPDNLVGNYNGVWRYDAMYQGTPYDWECAGTLRIQVHKGGELAGVFHTWDAGVCYQAWAQWSGELKGKRVTMKMGTPCPNTTHPEQEPIAVLTGTLDYDSVSVEGSMNLLCDDGSALQETIGFDGVRGDATPPKHEPL